MSKDLSDITWKLIKTVLETALNVELEGSIICISFITNGKYQSVDRAKLSFSMRYFKALKLIFKTNIILLSLNADTFAKLTKYFGGSSET